MHYEYEQAKKLRDQLEAEVDRTGNALKRVSGPGGPMGLTSAVVRAKPEWQKAKREADQAFAALQSFNKDFVRRFKKEIVQERRLN